MPSSSTDSAMTRDEIQTYLRKRLIAKLATLGRDGFPHVSPVWFLWADGRVFIATNRNSVKVKNIQADNRVALLLDSATHAEVWGVLIRGRAKLLFRGKSAKVNRQIHSKYLGKGAMRNAEVVAYFQSDDTTIAIEARSIISWDSRKSPVPRVRGLAIEL